MIKSILSREELDEFDRNKWETFEKGMRDVDFLNFIRIINEILTKYENISINIELEDNVVYSSDDSYSYNDGKDIEVYIIGKNVEGIEIKKELESLSQNISYDIKDLVAKYRSPGEDHGYYDLSLDCLDNISNKNKLEKFSAFCHGNKVDKNKMNNLLNNKEPGNIKYNKLTMPEYFRNEDEQRKFRKSVMNKRIWEAVNTINSYPAQYLFWNIFDIFDKNPTLEKIKFPDRHSYELDYDENYNFIGIKKVPAGCFQLNNYEENNHIEIAEKVKNIIKYFKLSSTQQIMTLTTLAGKEFKRDSLEDDMKKNIRYETSLSKINELSQSLWIMKEKEKIEEEIGLYKNINNNMKKRI